MVRLQIDELEDAYKLIRTVIQEKVRDPSVVICFAFTSNLISSGVREAIVFLCRYRLIDLIISTAGGIEEDMIKCLGQTYMGDFTLDGAALRKKGINRIGNLLVPNNNYCAFDAWIMPLLDSAAGASHIWGGAALVRYLGVALADTTSVSTCAASAGIPFICPAITDGSIGDMLYFHSLRSPGGGVVVDPAADVDVILSTLGGAKRAVGVFLGAGSPMHMACSLAARARGGFDCVLSVCTAAPGDGSIAGLGEQDYLERRWLRRSAKEALVAEGGADAAAGEAAADSGCGWWAAGGGRRYVCVRADATIIFPHVMMNAVIPTLQAEGVTEVSAEGVEPVNEGVSTNLSAAETLIATTAAAGGRREDRVGAAGAVGSSDGGAGAGGASTDAPTTAPVVDAKWVGVALPPFASVYGV